MVYLYIFSSIAIISIVSVLGIFFISLSKKTLEKITLFLVSLSAGSLLGGALLHLMPEALEEANSKEYVWPSLLGGILLFFVLEKIIHWRHCHVMTCKEHPHSLGIMNLVGDALHNAMDGMIIAGSFLISVPLGIASSIAIIMHEIPQEIADFGVLLYAGYSRARAIFLNFIISLTSFLGAIIVLLLNIEIEKIAHILLPLTAGGFIYIATADLIPELKKEYKISKSISQLIGMLLGIAIMALLK